MTSARGCRATAASSRGRSGVGSENAWGRGARVFDGLGTVLNGLVMELEVEVKISRLSPNGLEVIVPVNFGLEMERLGLLEDERVHVALLRVRLPEVRVIFGSSWESTGAVHGRNKERKKGAPDVCIEKLSVERGRIFSLWVGNPNTEDKV